MEKSTSITSQGSKTVVACCGLLGAISIASVKRAATVTFYVQMSLTVFPIAFLNNRSQQILIDTELRPQGVEK